MTFIYRVSTLTCNSRSNRWLSHSLNGLSCSDCDSESDQVRISNPNSYYVQQSKSCLPCSWQNSRQMFIHQCNQYLSQNMSRNVTWSGNGDVYSVKLSVLNFLVTLSPYINKTDCSDTVKILLKVALNTANLNRGVTRKLTMLANVLSIISY